MHIKVDLFELMHICDNHIFSHGDDLAFYYQSLSNSIEGGAKWLVNKIKGAYMISNFPLLHSIDIIYLLFKFFLENEINAYSIFKFPLLVNLD